MPRVHGRRICLLFSEKCWKGRDLWETSPKAKELVGAISFLDPQPGYLDTVGNSTVGILSVKLVNSKPCHDILSWTFPVKQTLQEFSKKDTGPLHSRTVHIANSTPVPISSYGPNLPNTPSARIHPKWLHKHGSVQVAQTEDSTISK